MSAHHRNTLGLELIGLARALDSIRSELTQLGSTLATERRDASEEPAVAAAGARLDRETFATFVREALRLCDRPDLLNRSPLCTSRWLAGRAPVGGRALSQFLRDECRRLFSSPRDQVLDRVMERSFFHPACKQQAIAADLGLTYSTYRRYRAQAVARLIDALYLQE